MLERRAGFTLIEVVGAFFMMVVILVFITGIFFENGRQREAATELMRERLSAAGTLDLIASDLEGAVFLTRSENENVESHPWRVLAEGTGDYGASAIRFVTQNAPQSNSAEHASNWVEVAYFLEENADGENVLWRWRSARPPSKPALGFPGSNEPGSVRIAVGVSEFGVRFLDSEGNWVDDWDSTYLPRQEALPAAAEISIALFRKARRAEALDGEAEIPGPVHVQRVSMVMRPIDVAKLVQLALGADGEGLDCFTIDQCLNEVDDNWFGDKWDSACEGDDPDLCDMLQNAGLHCWRDIENDYHGFAALAPASCGS
jgi:hypothetical protein